LMLQRQHYPNDGDKRSHLADQSDGEMPDAAFRRSVPELDLSALAAFWRFHRA